MAAPNLGFTHIFSQPRDPEAPTLLLLHGTGGDENDLVPLARALMPGAGILSPRGKVLERGMSRFFRRLAEGVFDEEDLRTRTEELAEFVVAAAAAHRFDLARVIAVGLSNGANIAASVLMLRPEILSAAILFRAMVPLVPESPPVGGHRGPPRRPTPVLLSNGRQDSFAGPAETERLAGLLRDAGARVTVAWQEAGHNLIPRDIEVAREWLVHAAAAPTVRGQV